MDLTYILDLPITKYSEILYQTLTNAMLITIGASGNTSTPNKIVSSAPKDNIFSDSQDNIYL